MMDLIRWRELRSDQTSFLARIISMRQPPALDYYLKQTIEKASQDVETKAPRFPPDGPRKSQLFRKQGLNRVLVFPGCFNPPHKAHLELLTHVFHNAGHDMHIAGAIVIPIHDDVAERKARKDADPLVFSQHQRGALWKAATKGENWVWIWDVEPQVVWEKFREKFQEIVKRDGIQVEFTLLTGGDHISQNEVCHASYWGCTDIVTSNVSRSADFYNPEYMLQLSGYAHWERARLDIERMERQVRAKNRGRSEAGALLFRLMWRLIVLRS
jgi:hypothetical protein